MWLYLGHCGALAGGRVERVLHFAPEPFLEKRLASLPGCEYVTTDIEPGRAMVAADITNLPFPACSFDIVICSHVLEHIPDDAAAIRELHRVMADGGWGLLMVPLRVGPTFEDDSVTAPADRALLFGQSDHVRIYGDDFGSRLEDAGFFVDVVRPQDLCSPRALGEMGIPLESERIFRVGKPASGGVSLDATALPARDARAIAWAQGTIRAGAD